MYLLFAVLVCAGICMIKYSNSIGRTTSRMYREMGFRWHDDQYYAKSGKIGGWFFIIFGVLMAFAWGL